MLRKYNSYREHGDNIKLGVLTSFAAGMVNVVSVIAFFAFTSNVTGHYAILAQEIAKGNRYQAAVVLLWVVLFFLGSFTSNMLIIHLKKNKKQSLSHSVPLLLEIILLAGAAWYLQNHYTETLQETEIIIGLLMFAMGLQNGLTASITNFAVKTTHLTGLTTDLGILISMLTRSEYRNDKAITDKITLLISILLGYMAGGITAGLTFAYVGYYTLYCTCAVLVMVIVYDYSVVRLTRMVGKRQPFIRKVYVKERV